ncbi:MAG TPA: hypothetical protein VFU13_08020 [Steroidobacteraceae bacterium]|nr:hypothetical protein [Steroidobacteraceae bacterium]
MDEQLKFVARLLDGEKMAVLCREFAISRKTGYKIYSRYKDCGPWSHLLGAAEDQLEPNLRRSARWDQTDRREDLAGQLHELRLRILRP